MGSLLLMKTGSTLESIRALRGDFEDWFAAGTGIQPWQVVDVQAGQPLPDPAGVSAVLITGSPAMVSRREPWSEAAARWLARALERDHLTVLGVCYGHQLLAHALGGEVGLNPLGLQMGTVALELTEQGRGDPLLGHLPVPFRVQATHSEAVLRLPPGATLLGHTPLDPCHAFRYGRRAWGVQFHPEFDAQIIRMYLAQRRELVCAAGQDPEALTRSARDSPHGEQVLRRFAHLAELQ